MNLDDCVLYVELICMPVLVSEHQIFAFLDLRSTWTGPRLRVSHSFDLASYTHDILRSSAFQYPMDLFLIPNNPEKTVIVSPNGVAHYKVATSKNKAGVKVSRIQRPAETEEESVVAEIEWKHWDRPTVVRSCLHGGLGEEQTRKGRVQAMDFLYKKHPFSA